MLSDRFQTLDSQTLIKFIILLPLIWCFSGMYIFANGDKILNGLVLIVLIVRFHSFGLQGITENIKNNKFLWIIIANLCFAVVAYFTYGISSNRFRMLTLAMLYLSILPLDLLKQLSFRYLTWTLSISVIIFLFIQYLDGHLFTRNWTINPIRIGVISAILVNMNIYYSILDTDKKSKIVSVCLAILTMLPLISSLSRSTWIAFVICFIFLIFKIVNIKKINIKIVLTLFILAVSMVVALKKPIEERIKITAWEIEQIQSNQLNTSIGLRLQVWKIGAYIIKSNWLTGVGNTGQIEIKQHLVNIGEVSQEAANLVHLHNQWINDLAKYGLLGIILTLLLIVYPLYASRNKSSQIPILILSCIYLTMTLTDMPLERSHPLGFYLICVYFLLQNPSKTKQTKALKGEK
ncbi:O-antigen ligase family protein [Vibrio sp. TH_r3]|uniref:O-antigen ligase family protein n=1 Tax=Vibrio sp. TH_r3 TaxID=3082084 RepID=UPI002954739B|nr:O-antigen ligase family protein [Vibrio sp. TH_r3]MDV7104200.1 O-antigen ligase family protein [Vibrio sp. TH_r3]